MPFRCPLSEIGVRFWHPEIGRLGPPGKSSEILDPPGIPWDPPGNFWKLEWKYHSWNASRIRNECSVAGNSKQYLKFPRQKQQPPKLIHFVPRTELPNVESSRWSDKTVLRSALNHKTCMDLVILRRPQYQAWLSSKSESGLLRAQSGWLSAKSGWLPAKPG